MNNNECLSLRIEKEGRTAWNTFLQKEFYLYGQSGMTVRQFMVETVGYDNCLIDEAVRTVFLNSSPVDDIDGAYIKDNDRLSLGSAMPGLVGICMGRDNPYKEFRSDIACQGNDGGGETIESIRVFMKIFSTLAVDTGDDLLKRGIYVNSGQLADFLGEQKERLIEGVNVSELAANFDDEVQIVVEFI